MLKSIKEKVLCAITAQPKLAMFGIGFAVTFVIGTAVNFGIQVQEAHAASALLASLVIDQASARSGGP